MTHVLVAPAKSTRSAAVRMNKKEAGGKKFSFHRFFFAVNLYVKLRVLRYKYKCNSVPLTCFFNNDILMKCII
jgi:hypothetical protein